ncbi:PilW family protein [Photobacterium leiognathi]|uniref:PilW family protein n=1 Tax=Photobacterium leiognathi TaxID=553611 RepID=UPI002980AC89|nr:type II secretion system protein [Photobacterium leiognathi]
MSNSNQIATCDSVTHKQYGFTFIELLSVLVIISVCTVVIIAYSKSFFFGYKVQQQVEMAIDEARSSVNAMYASYVMNCGRNVPIVNFGWTSSNEDQDLRPIGINNLDGNSPIYIGNEPEDIASSANINNYDFDQSKTANYKPIWKPFGGYVFGVSMQYNMERFSNLPHADYANNKVSITEHTNYNNHIKYQSYSGDQKIVYVPEIKPKSFDIVVHVAYEVDGHSPSLIRKIGKETGAISVAIAKKTLWDFQGYKNKNHQFFVGELGYRFPLKINNDASGINCRGVNAAQKMYVEKFNKSSEMVNPDNDGECNNGFTKDGKRCKNLPQMQWN